MWHSITFLPVQVGNAEQAFLTYRAPTPISVQRGQAALVPIIDTVVTFEELCIYNGAKLPNHPLRVWRLTNTSGLALEQGPVTITSAGQYQGEGLIRFTGVGDDLHVPFALEFGVIVAEDHTTLPRTLRDIRFDAERKLAVIAWFDATQTQYTLHSNTSRTLTVLIERRDRPHSSYIDSPTTSEVIEGHSRWTVALPAHERATLTIIERTVRQEYTMVERWSAEEVADLRAAGGFDDASYAHIAVIVAIEAEERTDAAGSAALDAESQAISVLQEQLRQNVHALRGDPQAGALRDQVLADLAASENRRRAISAERVILNARAQTRQERRAAAMDALFG